MNGIGHFGKKDIRISDIVSAANEIFCKDRQAAPCDAEPSPKELHLELTYDCNLRCLMCDLWDAHTRLPKERNRPEIKISDIERIFNKSNLLSGIDTIVLSGGEPFLASDFTEIINFLRKSLPRCFIWILSNLYDTELIMRKLSTIASKTNTIFGIGTSLDGIGETHDKVRGREGSFVRLLDNVKCIRNNFPGVRLFASFTATPFNFHQILDTYHLAADLEIPFSVQFSVERLAGRGQFLWLREQLDFVAKQAEDILCEMIGNKGLDGTLRLIRDRTISTDLFSQIIYWGNLVKYQRESKRLFKNCPSGSRFIMLSPDKELYFCPILKYRKIGNAANGSIDTIWQSETAHKLRSDISGGTCHCWLNCVVYPLAADCMDRERKGIFT